MLPFEVDLGSASLGRAVSSSASDGVTGLPFPAGAEDEVDVLAMVTDTLGSKQQSTKYLTKVLPDREILRRIANALTVSSFLAARETIPRLDFRSGSGRADPNLK